MYLFKFLRSLHFIGGVLVPFFMDWGRLSFVKIMILQSFFVISLSLLEIPTGAVADYLGRKTSLVFSALITSAAALIYSSYPNFFVFMLGEFLWALGGALMSGADEAIIYDSLKKIKSEKQSKKIFGKYNSFQMAALMISAPFGSAIAAYIGLRQTMMFMSIPFFLAFLLTLTLKEPKLSEKSIKKKYLETLFSGVKYVKNHKILKILAVDNISIAVLTFFAIWTYQPLLQQLNVPILYFGLVHAAISGIQIPFMRNFEKLEKIFGSKKKYLLLSAIITGISFILLGINTIIPVTIILLMMIAGFGLSRQTLFQSYLNKYIESHNRATVISTFSMIGRIIMGIIYPFIGLLVEWSLNYTLMIVGLMIIIFALISKVEEKHLVD
jgi:MFS family permease